MTNLADHVLKELLKVVTPPDDVLELLYPLLLREEKKGYESFYTPPRVLTREYVDVYAYSITGILRVTERYEVVDGGLSVSLAGLNGWGPDAIGEQAFIPAPFQWIDDKEFIPSIFTIRPGSPLFYELLQCRIGIRIPHHIRRLHTYIIGAPGSGKTQLIQQLITQDLKTNASIIVIDSQNDLINKLKQSTLISSERLVIIDPRDSVDFPIALNMFDIGDYENPDPVEFERHMNGVVEQLKFVFSAIMESSALTDKQSVLFNFCIRLLLTVPRATLFNLVELLEFGAEKYQGYINKLPALSQTFFAEAFTSNPRAKNQYRDTKSEVLRRLYTLLDSPAIARIFKSPKNKLNIGKEMDRGKIILISTDRSLLMKEGCAFFGRYFLSLISQATQNRANKSEHQRRKVYVYVDECGDYLKTADANVSDILEKGRKYNVGLTLSHQHLNQLSGEVFYSVKSNTATKFASRLSAGDERVLKSEMRVEAISRSSLIFTVNVEELGHFDVKIRPGIVENAGKRSAKQMENLIRENRAKYCVSGELPEKLPRIPVKEAKSDEPSGIPDDPLAPYT